MKYLNALLLALPLSATALDDPAIGIDGWYSADTEDNVVRRISSTLWFDGEDADLADQKYGVRVESTRYSNPTASYDGATASLVVDDRRTDTWYMGHVGVGTLNGNSYVVSDLSAMHFVNRNMLVSAGVYSDIIDSPLGLDDGTTIAGTYIGAEVYNERFGAAATVKQAWMSDDNNRTYTDVRLYMLVGMGFNVYVNDKQFWSHGESSLYWNPDKFQRTNVGLGYRERINGYLVSAHYDIGDTNTDGFKDTANSWRFSVESPRSRGVRWGLTAGQDLSPFNYDFNYIHGFVKIDW